jgi:hypothetical protein
VTKVVWLLDDCPYPEMLVLASAANAAPAAGLPVLTYLSPAAVPAAALPYSLRALLEYFSFTLSLIKSCCT